MRAAILAASQEVFSQVGYASARTRAIADKAGASEQLLFAHFGSKSGLFEEAVLAPVKVFLIDWAEAFPDDFAADQGDPHAQVSAFLSGYLRVLLANRRLLVAYLAASTFHVDEFAGSPAAAGLGTGIRRLQDLAEEAARSHGFPLAEPELQTRVILATSLGLAVFNDLLFTDGPPDEERLIETMTELLLLGLTGQG